MIVSVAAAVSVFYALWSLALGLLFVVRLRIPGDRPAARITLVLPATGALAGIEDLLDALSVQSLRPCRTLIAVESTADPAFSRIVALAEQYPQLNIELIVAGLSSLRSQKCTNLLAALDRLRPDDAYVVFLDADIRPQSWWLAGLIGPLAGDRADIVNGYRWPMPMSLRLGTALAAGIDRAIAVLPRLSSARTIWGGSLAVTRRALEILDLPNTIGRTLTEDLPIGDRAAATGLRVLTRRAIRPTTPLSGDLVGLWRFGRRQYQLIRLYRPRLWCFAAVLVSTDLVARLVLLTTFAAPTATLALACLGSITVEIRLAVGRKLGAGDGTGFRLLQHLFAWILVPGPGLHAAMIWGGIVTSPVLWAHARYVVDKAGRVLAVDRRPYPDQSI